MGELALKDSNICNLDSLIVREVNKQENVIYNQEKHRNRFPGDPEVGISSFKAFICFINVFKNLKETMNSMMENLSIAMETIKRTKRKF